MSCSPIYCVCTSLASACSGVEVWARRGRTYDQGRREVGSTVVLEALADLDSRTLCGGSTRGTPAGMCLSATATAHRTAAHTGETAHRTAARTGETAQSTAARTWTTVGPLWTSGILQSPRLFSEYLFIPDLDVSLVSMKED